MTGLVLLCREFRTHDNSVLNEAFKLNDEVIVLFVFNKEQINSEYFSKKSFELLRQSVYYLNEELNNKLTILYGNSNAFVDKIISKFKIQNFYITLDYTPYARKRADILKDICKKYKCTFNEVQDHVLYFPSKGYQKFTPFYNLAKKVKPTVSNYQIDIKKIKKLKSNTKYSTTYIDLKKIALQRLSMDYSNYKTNRDIPSIDGTTQLSRYLKYGILSIREVYNKVNKDIQRELFWRDFYYQVAWYFPHVLEGQIHEKNKSLKLHYDKIKWLDINSGKGKQYFLAWSTGKTGFALVDAGMKQLLQTGWMHNRLRMVTATFLIKILHIDWRHGEKFFAQHLIDYDPCQNNGGWQWCASSGADSQPYFRIFNPDLQLINHDPECKYVKTYLPQYAKLSTKEILNLDKIVDYAKEKEVTIQMYKKLYK